MRMLMSSSIAMLVACAEAGAPTETDLPYPALFGDSDGDGDALARHGRPCHQRGYRDFDFWLGRWVITQPDGSPGGVSAITRELGGCAVMETYQGGGGRSLNVYDAQRDRWTQTYIDGGGLLLRLAGALDGEAMVMSDEVRTTPTGLELTSQITWTPAADGSVRQVWLLSTDGGESYNLNFDGTYRPGSFEPPAVGASVMCNQTQPAFRGADFLLGSWTVETERGLRLGRAELRSTAGGCLIEEDFTGPLGYAARAFIAYDRVTRTWYRVHGDTTGFVHELAGAVVGTEATLRGEVLPGVSATMRWTAAGADELRQRWEVSAGGAPVATRTLVYRRAAARATP
jgi:hypothetical protein